LFTEIPLAAKDSHFLAYLGKNPLLARIIASENGHVVMKTLLINRSIIYSSTIIKLHDYLQAMIKLEKFELKARYLFVPVLMYHLCPSRPVFI
jgi:hypothetical protein